MPVSSPMTLRSTEGPISHAVQAITPRSRHNRVTFTTLNASAIATIAAVITVIARRVNSSPGSARRRWSGMERLTVVTAHPLASAQILRARTCGCLLRCAIAGGVRAAGVTGRRLSMRFRRAVRVAEASTISWVGGRPCPAVASRIALGFPRSRGAARTPGRRHRGRLGSPGTPRRRCRPGAPAPAPAITGTPQITKTTARRTQPAARNSHGGQATSPEPAPTGKTPGTHENVRPKREDKPRSNVKAFWSPVTESNRRPSPYHGQPSLPPASNNLP